MKRRLFAAAYGASHATCDKLGLTEPGAAFIRSVFQRTAGHPPPGVPLTSGYNPDATMTKEVPGFGGDKRVSK